MTFNQDCLRGMLSIYFLVIYKSCPCISLDRCKAMYLRNINLVLIRIPITEFIF